MRLAADAIKRVTLELGGKSANIGFCGYQHRKSRSKARYGVYSVMQVKIAVQEAVCWWSRSINDEFLEQLTERFSEY